MWTCWRRPRPSWRTWCGWRTATVAREEATVYLGLGSNLGDRAANLRAALEKLMELMRVEAVSGVYRSEPVGFGEQPDFWNLAVRAATRLSPHELLESVKRLERELGREPSFRNAPRPIDVDILLYGDRTVASETLQVPHPRLEERAFVLRPLLEIAPDLRHPLSGRPLSETLARRDDWEETERLFDAAGLRGDHGAR